MSIAKAFIGFTCLLFSLSGFCQDSIYRKSGQVISARVTEIGPTTVSYKIPGNDKVIYQVEQKKLRKIVFANGQKQLFTKDFRDSSYYTHQKRNLLKLDVVAPFNGYSVISFEHSISPVHSYEISLGIIGAGVSNTLDYNTIFGSLGTVKTNPFGGFVAVSYKFNKLAQTLFGSSKVSHRLQGLYARPTLYGGTYKENRLEARAVTYFAKERPQTNFAILHLEIGHQWIFKNRFAADIFGGVGYGIDNKTYYDNIIWNDETYAYNYANHRIGKSPAPSVTFGVKFGMLLGSSK